MHLIFKCYHHKTSAKVRIRTQKSCVKITVYLIYWMRPMDLLGGIPFSYWEIARNWVACLDVTVLILLLCEGMMVLQVTWLFPSGEAILGTCILWTWKPAEEDCSLVLTTSRGHVTMAPTVPAMLNKNPKYQQYTKWFLKTGSTAIPLKLRLLKFFQTYRKFSIRLNLTRPH